MPRSLALQTPFATTLSRTGEQDLSDRTIICIDDEVSILNGMRDLLENWGCYVICASSGDRALKLTRMSNAKPDLIICDYRLSNVENGIQAIRYLQETLVPHIPAILITGDSDPSLAEQAQQHGIELLEKPISARKLRPVIEKIIGLARTDSVS